MNKIDTSEEKIDLILNRGVIADIFPSKKTFRDRLLSGDRLKIYLGIDPTSRALHLGHAQNIILLEKFRKLGHETILLIGSFTAKIGDPSEKASTRTVLSDVDIKENVKSIIKQIDNIININDKNNPATIKYNGDCLSSLTFKEVVDLASNFTVQQMIERNMFKKRIKEDKPIFLHEFLYPLMQGYDSVKMDIDVEIGGTDQTFNMMAGRTLLKKKSNKNKFVVTTKLIENPKTGELMSKSNGTGVFLDLSPQEMFGAIMALPDEMIVPLFTGVTDVPLLEIEKVNKSIEGGGLIAKDMKIKLAIKIVWVFYSEKDANAAKVNFFKVFSENKKPQEIERYTHTKKEDTVANLLQVSGMAESMTASRRLVLDRAVEIDNKIVTDPKEIINLNKVRFFKVGKHRFKEMDS